MKIKEFKDFINENIIKDFIKDFKNEYDILSSGVIEQDGKIVIYLDGRYPDKEYNAINKLVRTKYKDTLKRVDDDEEDTMTFKVID